MPWPKTSLKSASAALTAPGTTTYPPSARRPITSVPSRPRVGAEYPATTASSGTKCRTPVLMEGDAATPMAITSHANATLATSPWKNARSSTITTTRGATTSARGNSAARGLPCARRLHRSSSTNSRTRAPLTPLAPPLPPYDYVPGDNEGSD